MAVHQVGASRDLLANVRMLAGVAPETIDRLVERLRSVHVRAGHVVVTQGDAADRIFLVRSGRLRVSVEDVDGDHRVVRELGTGAVLGELALLTGAPRSATVEAVRDSVLLELADDAFHELLQQDKAFAIAVARSLALQLQASGGLSLPTSRPAVISVRSLGPGPDPASWAAALSRALERFGSVATLTASDAHEEPAAVLDRAEREHAHVLLVDAGTNDAWRAFCARQADRYVLLAGREAGDLSDAPAGADLVVVEPLAGARLVELNDVLAPRARHVAALGDPPTVDRVVRRLVRRALGLVLSGGGARGYAHIGAIDALVEAGFDVDRVGGCSIGAFIGGMYALGRTPEEMYECCRVELVRRSPFNDYTLPRVALIRSRKAGRMLERVFGETLVEELGTSFFSVSADLLASRTIVHRRGSLVEAVGASMSIPGLVPPLARPGHLLVDGGVLNNLPVDVMVADDEGPVVAVDVVRRLDADDSAVAPALPTITETLSRATVLGSAERAERNRKLADVLVTPDVQDVALREFSALDRARAAGGEAMRATLDAGAAERLRERLDEPI
jgi:predicted acylesterase/phospholipase RssA